MFPQRGTPSDDRLMIDYFSDHFFGFVWCSVYKKSFLRNNNIFFNEEYHVIDDIDFMYSVLSHHPKVFLSSDILQMDAKTRLRESSELYPACSGHHAILR